jgi:hypothetical protein
MKKLLLILLCLPLIGFGQISNISTNNLNSKKREISQSPYDSTRNSITHPEQLIGQTLYFTNDGGSSSKSKYNNFVLDYRKSSRRKNIYKLSSDYIHYKTNDSPYTDYRKIEGHYFTVIDFIPSEGNDYFDKNYFKLKDDEGNVLFMGMYTKDKMLNDLKFIIVGYFEKLKDKLVRSTLSRNEYTNAINVISGEEIKLRSPSYNEVEVKWECVDIQIVDNERLGIIIENQQGDRALISDFRDLKFKDKILESDYGDNYNNKNLSYHLYETELELDCCFEKEKPLICFKNRLKSVAKDYKYCNENFNYENFDIVSYENSIIIEDDKGEIDYISLSFSPYKDILCDRFIAKTKLREICQDLSYKKANENQRKFNIYRVYNNSPNSAGGVNVEIDYFYYCEDKDIKYITFTVIPYNSVGDIQYCDITGKSKANLQYTGPIGANARPNTHRIFENVWYNISISKIKLVKVEVEYTDGIRYIYANELNKVLSPYGSK